MLKKPHLIHYNQRNRTASINSFKEFRTRMLSVKVCALITTLVVTISCATSSDTKSQLTYGGEEITFDANRNPEGGLRLNPDKKYHQPESEEDGSSIPPRTNDIIVNYSRQNVGLLRDNSPDPTKFRGRSSETPTFFTQAQEDQHLKFPNDTVNPVNRLQAELTETEKDQIKKSQAAEKLNFINDDSTSPGILPSDRKDEIRTMHLSLEIMKKSLWNDENAVFSPLSICNVLALLLLGSNGRTQKELASVLTTSDSIEATLNNQTYHTAFRKLLNRLKNKSDEVTLEIANQVFTDTTFPILETYVQNSATFYDTQVKSFDFHTDAKAFQDEVNAWVRTKTKGKINSIIEEPPSPSTTLAFVNAVYFKGNWEVPFFEPATKKKTFYVNANETLDVQMMMRELTIPYAENDDFKIAAIPYKGNRTVFYAILPKPSKPKGLYTGVDDLKRVEQNLSEDSLHEIIRKMKPQNVAVKLPKMTISTDGHMKDILTNIGVPSIFENTLADFSKISSNGGLYVSAVHHKAVIEVNEKGTEAAAVTVGTSDRILEVPVAFEVNKPFTFFLYDVKQQTVLFWGRVTRPK